MSLRRIVLVRSHEWLTAGWKKRSFGPAGAGLDRSVKVKGVEWVEGSHPVPAFTRLKSVGGAQLALAAAPSKPATPSHDAYAVVGSFADREAVERMKRDQANDVVGVFADPTIEASPAYCLAGPVGTFKSVMDALDVPSLRAAKLTGRKVRIAIVDTGISGSHLGPNGKELQKNIDPKSTFSAKPGYVPGSSPIDHGTMCAFDALLAAPDATLIDLPLLSTAEANWNAFLSDAIAAYADLVDLLNATPGPLVVSNSWALFDRSDDEPVGSPENYSANPDHPFNHMVGALVAAGADVLFAAGNCGQDCPDGRCGATDVGPGASIHGANSHPSVITIAAVTEKGTRLGYSSQGPGDLSDRKPDVAAYSHFAGSGVYKADGGTSAACPVAAGVVAALRQKWTKITPAAMKGIIQLGTKRGPAAWSYDLGYGILNAKIALTQKQPLAAAALGKKARGRKAFGASWMLVKNPPDKIKAYVEDTLAPLSHAASPKRKHRPGTK
jgi:subtilisin family serine protease